MNSSFQIASLPPDIPARIRSAHPVDHDAVTGQIESFARKHDYLQHPRIIRCILFLVATEKMPLARALEVAAYDPRDVMMWAEYVNRGAGETPERVRDFNKPFGENDIT